MAVLLWMIRAIIDRLRDDIDHFLNQLIQKGILNRYFLQLRELEDESDPDFLSNLLTGFFEDTDKILNNIRQLLMEKGAVKFDKVLMDVHQLVGSSCSIGAKHMHLVCVALRKNATECNRLGCLENMTTLDFEYDRLKENIQVFLEMDQRRKTAEAPMFPRSAPVPRPCVEIRLP